MAADNDNEGFTWTGILGFIFGVGLFVWIMFFTEAPDYNDCPSAAATGQACSR